MTNMPGSQEYISYNKGQSTMNSRRDEVFQTVQSEQQNTQNGGYTKWQKRNYADASFMNPNTYKFSDAQAVFQVAMNGNQGCNHNCQQQTQQQHSHCVMPIYMNGGQEQDSSLKEECEYLRIKVQKLENMGPEVKIVKEVVQDTQKINALEIENQKLRYSLAAEQERNRLREQEVNDLKYKMSLQEQQFRSDQAQQQATLKEYEKKMLFIANELDRLNALLRQKDEEIHDWTYRFEELESQSVTVIQEKVTYLSNEVQVWKERFIKTNKEFHQLQEEHILLQASTDALKNKGQTVREVTVKEVRRSGITTRTVDPQQSTQEIVRLLMPP